MALSIVVGVVVGSVIVYRKLEGEYAEARDSMRSACKARIAGLQVTHVAIVMQLTAERDHYHTNLRAWYEYAGRVTDENTALREERDRLYAGTVDQLDAHNARLMAGFTKVMRDRRAKPLMTTATDNYATGVFHPKDDQGEPVFDEPDGVTVTPDTHVTVDVTDDGTTIENFRHEHTAYAAGCPICETAREGIRRMCAGAYSRDGVDGVIDLYDDSTKMTTWSRELIERTTHFISEWSSENLNDDEFRTFEAWFIDRVPLIDPATGLLNLKCESCGHEWTGVTTDPCPSCGRDHMDDEAPDVNDDGYIDDFDDASDIAPYDQVTDRS